MADWTDAGLATEIQRLKSWRSKVEAIEPVALPDRQKFEREYMLAVLDGNLFWLETADWPHKNPSWYSPWIDPSVYLDRPYADLAARMKAYSTWASNVPTAAAAIKANLRGSLPRAFIDIGTNTFGPLADFLRKDVVTVFKDVGDDAARVEFTKQNEAAASAFADLNRHLESLRPSQTENFAMGSDLLARMLYATERVNTRVDEIEAMGRADLLRNKQALADACRQFAPGKTIAECVAKEEASKTEGGDFGAYARQQLVDLKRFVIDHRVVTIPGEEEARVKQAPPYRAQNSAYIDTPGPYEKNMPAFFNIAAPDPKWPKAKQLAYDPAYLNYTMGKLMIRRLRDDWCKARGAADDKSCWHDFHGAFLSYGGPPIPLVRGLMMGTPPQSVF